MDVQLRELIDTIRREGVDEAERTSVQILERARAEAEEIVSAAQARAQEIERDAETQARRFEHTGRETLRHAGRDLVLALQSQITILLRKTVTAEVERVLSDEQLGTLIVAFVTALQNTATTQDRAAGQNAATAQEGAVDAMELLLPPEQAERLTGHIYARLAEHIRQGSTIRPYPGLESGFRVSLRDGSEHIDVSADSVAEALCERLGPQLAQLLRDVK